MVKYFYFIIFLVFSPLILADGNNWYDNYVLDDDTVLCTVTNDKDEFVLVTSSGGRIKVGYKLDITPRNKNMPLSYRISWKFLNNKNEYIELNVKPNVALDEIITDDNGVFANKIEYKSINLSGAGSVRVIVNLIKLDDFSLLKKMKPEHAKLLYGEVEICEIPSSSF